MKRLRQGLEQRLLSLGDLCACQPNRVELVIARRSDDRFFGGTDRHVHNLVQCPLKEIVSFYYMYKDYYISYQPEKNNQ